MQPKPGNRGLKILIPGTILFEEGSPVMLVSNNTTSDMRMIFVKNPKKLIVNEIKKFFFERRRNHKKIVSNYFPELRKFSSSKDEIYDLPSNLRKKGKSKTYNKNVSFKNQSKKEIKKIQNAKMLKRSKTLNSV